MDIISIKELKVDCIIGVRPWERLLKQSLKIDFDFQVDVTSSADSDLLSDSVDYSAVASRITEIVSHSDFFLIEKMSTEIVRQIMELFNLSWCRIRITKTGVINNAKSVSITIERTKQQIKS